jgi:hypothetical protein
VSKEEDEVRAALVTWLRSQDALSEDTTMVHFMVLCTGISHTDDQVERISVLPSDQFSFTHQLGVLDYTLTSHRSQV